MVNETGKISGKAVIADKDLCFETIEPGSLIEASSSDEAISLSDYEFLSSYNWIDKDSPAIYVPGAPPVWRPEELPFNVSRDKGKYFTGQSTARCAAYPAEALFRSLAVMQPRFSMKDIDLVTDRSCLRKLLRFVSGGKGRSFRIDVRVQGDVMFLCRAEAELRQIILDLQDSGYGHNFEKATMGFDENVKDSSGHHRVVRYSLGSIRCLVRYETDGYCNDLEESSKATKTEEGGDADDLLGPVEVMSIASSRVEAPGSVQVVNKGRVVQPSTIIEVKARSGSRKVRLDNMVPQLWFAQTQNLFVGYHNGGVFHELDRISMKPEFERWEKEQQNCLRKLVSLIAKVKVLAQTAGSQGCALVYEAKERPACMRIYKSEGAGAALPEDIVKEHEWRV